MHILVLGSDIIYSTKTVYCPTFHCRQILLTNSVYFIFLTLLKSSFFFVNSPSYFLSFARHRQGYVRLGEKSEKLNISYILQPHCYTIMSMSSIKQSHTNSIKYFSIKCLLRLKIINFKCLVFITFFYLILFQIFPFFEIFL